METSVILILSFMRDNIPRKESNVASVNSTPIPEGNDTTVISVSDSEQETLSDVHSVQSSSIKKYIHSEETTPELGSSEKSDIVPEEVIPEGEVPGKMITGEAVIEEVVSEEVGKKEGTKKEGTSEEEVTKEAVINKEAVNEEVTINTEAVNEEATNEEVAIKGSVTKPLTSEQPFEPTVQKEEVSKEMTPEKNSIERSLAPEVTASEHQFTPGESPKPTSFSSTPFQPILLLCHIPPLSLVEDQEVCFLFLVKPRSVYLPFRVYSISSQRNYRYLSNHSSYI